MRSRISITLGIATLSLAAVACTALLGDFEEGASDSALTDAAVDTSVADASMDTSIALDSNTGDAGLESGADAIAEVGGGGDAGADASTSACLPAFCTDAGPQAYCFSFDNLGDAAPPFFIGTGSEYGQGKPQCDDGLSLLRKAEPFELKLNLPRQGGATQLDFDLLVKRTFPVKVQTPREFLYVFGPSGENSKLFALAINSIVSPSVGIGFRNIPDVAQKDPIEFLAGDWQHVSIILTLRTIDLSLPQSNATFHLDLSPATGTLEAGTGRPPALELVALSEDDLIYTDIRIDNLVIITTPAAAPVDAGP